MIDFNHGRYGIMNIGIDNNIVLSIEITADNLSDLYIEMTQSVENSQS